MFRARFRQLCIMRVFHDGGLHSDWRLSVYHFEARTHNHWIYTILSHNHGWARSVVVSLCQSTSSGQTTASKCGGRRIDVINWILSRGNSTLAPREHTNNRKWLSELSVLFWWLKMEGRTEHPISAPFYSQLQSLSSAILFFSPDALKTALFYLCSRTKWLFSYYFVFFFWRSVLKSMAVNCLLVLRWSITWSSNHLLSNVNRPMK